MSDKNSQNWNEILQLALPYMIAAPSGRIEVRINNGGLQHRDVPQDIKDLFRTAWREQYPMMCNGLVRRVCNIAQGKLKSSRLVR